MRLAPRIGMLAAQQNRETLERTAGRSCGYLSCVVYPPLSGVGFRMNWVPYGTQQEVVMNAEPVGLDQRGLPKQGAPRRISFFLCMAVIMVTLNFLGFAPTYFLRSLSDVPPLPLRLQIHGAFFTAWFLVFLAQTSLVAARNLALHRKLGTAGVLLAGAMVASGLHVLYVSAMAYHDFDADLFETTTLVWANLTLLTAFAVFVGLGIRFRRRPEAHKRLMLLACLSMISMSTARIGRYEILRLSDDPVVNETVYGLGGLAALFASVFLYDVFKRRRPHPAVLWGVPLFLGSIVTAVLIVPNTPFGQGLILLLG